MVVNDHNNPGVGRIQRRRLLLLLICAGLWTGLLLGRLGHLQIVLYDELVEHARNQQEYAVAVPATRGEIVAADGTLLAASSHEKAIYVHPHHLDDPVATAEALAPALQMPVEVVTRLFESSKPLEYLHRSAPKEIVDAVQAVKVELGLYQSIGMHPSSRRYYPNRQLAAHVLGFVDSENSGAAGIEYALDETIRGQDGRWMTLKDGGQTPIDPDGMLREDPIPGHDIFLTLNPVIQASAEDTLARVVNERGAEGAAAVVMNPRTGAVLALASYPTFNPNVRNAALVDLSSKNSAVNHAYEPGSTFKIFTAAAGFRDDIVFEDELIDCQGGALRVANHTYHDWRSGFGVMPFSQVVVNSSNVGMIKVGLRMQPERFHEWLRGFGFGQTTGIELPGEAPGILRAPESWSALSQSSMIIGQEVGVTPLQLATAVSAIANGGLLMEPHLVQEIRDADGELQMRREPQVRRRVLDEATARRVLTVLEAVVDPSNNTGKAAGIPGYRIAGKTGTAQKIGPDRQYSQYMSSFVGILPASAPELVILVVVDAPDRSKGYYGTVVAAPAFRAIAETAIRVLRLAPDAPVAPRRIIGS